MPHLKGYIWTIDLAACATMLQWVWNESDQENGYAVVPSLADMTVPTRTTQ